jgi:hypothetical protein
MLRIERFRDFGDVIIIPPTVLYHPFRLYSDAYRP